MKLHEAIVRVILESGKAMSAASIAERINNKKLYVRGDGQPLPPSQISARVNKYRSVFEYKDGKIYLSSYQEKYYEHAINFFLLFINDKLTYKGLSNSQIHLFKVFYLSYIWSLKDKYPNSKGFHIKLDYSLREYYRKLSELSEIKEIEDLLNLVGDKTISTINSYSLEIGWYYLDSHLFFQHFKNLIIEGVGERYGQIGFSTPSIISSIIRELIDLESIKSVFNPGAGLCFLFSGVIKDYKSLEKFLCTDINQNLRVYGLIYLFTRKFSHGNYIIEDICEYEDHGKYDLVISNPPFAVKSNFEYEKEKMPIESSDLFTHFVMNGLNHLKNGGKAIFVTAQYILFSERKDIVQFRKYLIDNLLLTEIINLPAGILNPYTNIPISIILLTKGDKKNNLRIIDASSFDLETTKDSDLVQAILNKYYSNNEVSLQNKVALPLMPWETSKNNIPDILDISYEGITKNEYSLSTSRYKIEEINFPGENTVSLSEIVKPIQLASSDKKELPIVTITHLQNKFPSPYLDIEKLNSNYSNKRGKLLEEEALLIGKISGSSKPTICKASKNKPVIISTNISVLKVNTDKFHPEYVAYELRSDYVSDQIQMISSGATTLKSFTEKKLLTIKVKAPINLDDQMKSIQKFKEDIIAQKYEELTSTQDLLSFNKIDYEKLLGVFSHELNNSLSRIKGHTKDIERGLKYNTIRFDLPVSDLGVHTFQSAIDNAFASLKTAFDLRESLEKVICFDREIQPEKIDMSNFIEGIFRNYSNSDPRIKFIYALNDNREFTEKIQIEGDKMLLDHIFSNLIENSIKHGFTNDSEQLTVYINFQIDNDTNELLIEFINDGNAWPEDYSLSEFLEFRNCYNINSGSGIGGFIIGEAIKKHHGRIDLIKTKTSISSKERISDGEANQIIIKPSVHFQITFPIRHEEN